MGFSEQRSSFHHCMHNGPQRTQWEYSSRYHTPKKYSQLNVIYTYTILQIISPLGYQVFDDLILAHLRDKLERQNIQSNFWSSSLHNNGWCVSISEIKYQILKLNFLITCKLSAILFTLSIPYAFLLWKCPLFLVLAITAYKMSSYNMTETFATY